VILQRLEFMGFLYWASVPDDRGAIIVFLGPQRCGYNSRPIVLIEGFSARSFNF